MLAEEEDDMPALEPAEGPALPNYVPPMGDLAAPALPNPPFEPAFAPALFAAEPVAPVAVRAPDPVMVHVAAPPVPVDVEFGHIVVRPDPRVAQLERQLRQSQSQVEFLQEHAAQAHEQIQLARRVSEQRLAEQRVASLNVEAALEAARNENARIVRQLAGFEEAQEDVLRMRTEVQFLREQQDEMQKNLQSVHDERVGALMTLEQVRHALAEERQGRATERRLLEAAVVEANDRLDQSRMVVRIRDQQLRDAQAQIYVLREERNGDIQVRRLHEQEFRELQATLARILQQYREMERQRNQQGPIIEAVSDSSDEEPELQERDRSPSPPPVRSRIRFRFDRGPGIPDYPVEEPHGPVRAARRRAGPPPPEAEVIVVHGSSSEDEPEVSAAVPARAPTPGVPVVVLEEPLSDEDTDLSDVDDAPPPHVVRMFEGPGNRPVPRFFERPRVVVPSRGRRRGRSSRRAAKEAMTFMRNIIFGHD